MTAYYNEIDPFAAQWLREIIKAGASPLAHEAVASNHKTKGE